MSLLTDDLQRTFFRTLNGVVGPLVKRGVASPLPVGFGAVVVEHTGRVSGATYEAPLLGLRVGNRVWVSTVRENSQWLRNVESGEDTAVWLCGRKREVAAQVQRGPLNVAELSID
ncbi:MAG: nitroreductase/quinone reductase family protein [Actinomycetota bacterium]